MVKFLSNTKFYFCVGLKIIFIIFSIYCFCSWTYEVCSYYFYFKENKITNCSRDTDPVTCYLKLKEVRKPLSIDEQRKFLDFRFDIAFLYAGGALGYFNDYKDAMRWLSCDELVSDVCIPGEGEYRIARRLLGNDNLTKEQIDCRVFFWMRKSSEEGYDKAIAFLQDRTDMTENCSPLGKTGK